MDRTLGLLDVYLFCELLAALECYELMVVVQSNVKSDWVFCLVPRCVERVLLSSKPKTTYFSTLICVAYVSSNMPGPRGGVE